MKKLILVPLFAGVLLSACSRSNTSSQKLSSNDQTDPNKPVYDSQAASARKDAKEQAQVAATNTAPATGKETAATASVPPAPNPSATPAPASENPPAATPSSNAPAAASVAESSTEKKTDFSARMAEWKLNPDDIKDELKSSGQIVRGKTVGAGEPTGPMDNVLVTQIQGKLKDDSAISSLKIEVTAEKGIVTLSGSAQSLDQIGKAIALSLDTPGVTQTVSKIKLEGGQ